MNQQELDIKTEEKTPTNVSDFRFAPIKGQPMLQWRGKRPFTSTSYFPRAGEGAARRRSGRQA